MTYWERLQELSAGKCLKECIKEWSYTWNLVDAWMNSCSSCGICGTSIRYEFEIRNTLNSNILFTWCECIKKFDISILDSMWNKLSEDEARIKLNSDKNNYIKEANKSHVINTLVRLSSISTDTNFDFNSFVKYYSEHDYFSPKQMLCIEFNLSKHKLTYDAGAFRVCLKKKRDKDNFRSMPDWQKQKVKPFLSKEQVNRYSL